MYYSISGKDHITIPVLHYMMSCPYHEFIDELQILHHNCSLVPRPHPAFSSLLVQKSGRGPGIFSYVSGVTGRKDGKIPGSPRFSILQATESLGTRLSCVALNCINSLLHV